jgi:hypothetical protein
MGHNAVKAVDNANKTFVQDVAKTGYLNILYVIFL